MSSVHPPRSETRIQKSTNVRSLPVGLRMTRVGLRSLAAVSPSLGAALARKVAFTVRRFERPAWEQELLDAADEQVFVPMRDGDLVAWTWGQGPRVLLVHGWEGRGSQLGKLIDPLTAVGFQVVAFDGPGHGASTTSRASLPDQADAVIRMAEQYGPFEALVGHSMGAAAAVMAAARGLETKRLVLFAPPAAARDHFNFFSRLFGLNADVKRRLIARVEHEFNLSIDDLEITQYAPALKQATLVLHDREDKEVPFENGLALAKAFPNGELWATDDLGHRRILKDEALLRGIADFLSWDEGA